MAQGTAPAVGLGLLALGGTGLVGLAGYVVYRWDGRGALSLASFTGVLGVGALALLVSGVAIGVPAASVSAGDVDFATELWFAIGNSILVVQTIPWLGFVLWYTGQDERLGIDRTWLAAGTVPLLGLLANNAWTLVDPGTAELASAWLVESLSGAAVTFALLYWIAIHFTGVVAVLRTVYVYGHQDTPQGGALGVAAVAPLLFTVLSNQLRDPAMGAGSNVSVGVAATGFLVGGAAIGVALFGYDALGWTPAAGNIGRATVLEEIDDLVFVTDEDGDVTEVNRTVVTELGRGKGDLLGRPLSAVVGADLDDLQALECVTLGTAAGNREFDADVSTLTDQRGDRIGHVVTLHDVTDRTIRQQRIEVLNRVLRHNLRNKMSIVKGTADYVADGELPPAEIADGLGEVADELVDIGEKAREIEKVIQEREHLATPIDVSEMVASTAD